MVLLPHDRQSDIFSQEFFVGQRRLRRTSQLINPALSDLAILEDNGDRRPPRDHVVRDLPCDDPVQVRRNTAPSVTASSA